MRRAIVVLAVVLAVPALAQAPAAPPATGKPAAAKPAAAAPAKKPAPPAPSTDAIRKVWAYWYDGASAGPILVDLVPCLEVDQGKDSPTRFDCKKKVGASVPAGTTVYVWTRWLVPQGPDVTDVMVQYLRDGVVRTTRDVKLTGGSLRYRTWVGHTLRKKGHWKVVVRRGDMVLGSETFDVS